MAKPFRILSLDGGGIRGVITAVLLQRLANEPGLEDFLQRTQLVAGTSTGGLIALGLADGIDLDKIVDLYESRGPRIFDDSWLDNVVDLGRIAGAQYGNKHLRQELKRLFDDRTLAKLKNAQTMRVLITAFDLDTGKGTEPNRTWKPKLFHNFPGSDSDGGELAVDVGLYTSAAPTYFPSVDGYIDGGVFANNPAMCALAQSQDERIGTVPALVDVRLLSLGTGINRQYIEGKTLDWGKAQWVGPIIDLMMDGVNGIADYQCSQMLGKRFHRLSPEIPQNKRFTLDDTKRIGEMVQLAHAQDLRPTVRWLKENWF